jgi:hypothetical protein
MNMYKLPAIAAASWAAVAAATPAIAHHSFAMYDNSKDVVLDGVVREFKWANPHGSIHLTVTQDGKPAEYSIEMSSLNVMSRQGWTRNTLKAGERVKVTMHPLKDGTQGGSFVGAVKADGTVLRATAPP